jgi:hypothetical protein
MLTWGVSVVDLNLSVREICKLVASLANCQGAPCISGVNSVELNQQTYSIYVTSPSDSSIKTLMTSLVCPVFRHKYSHHINKHKFFWYFNGFNNPSKLITN